MKFSKSFFAAVLVVVGLALYATSFGNAMFWDDDDFILKNQYIQNTQYLPNLFTENVIAGSGLVSDYWRPVLLLVFSLEWHLWGDAVTGWHVVNALFHTANGLLLFWLLLNLFSVVARNEGLGERRGNLASIKQFNNVNTKQKDKIASSVGSLLPPHDREGESYKSYTTYRTYVSFFVALVFLIHPVQVEAVAYVNSLGDSLSVFWMLSALVLYVRYLHAHSSWAFVGAVALYPLALMSKETAVILPGLLLLVDALLGAPAMRFRAWVGWMRGVFSRLAPFFALGLAYVMTRVTVLNFKNTLNLYDQATAYTESVWVRLLTFCKVLWEYAQILLWPQTLHMERRMESATSIFEFSVLAGIGAIVLLGAIAVWAWRRGNRLPLFGFLWFLVALAPTSNIAVPINGVLYEHWLYVPLIGVALLVSSVLGDLLVAYKSYKTYRTYITAGAVMLLLAALLVRSGMRIREWNDPVTFYTQTAQHAPDSYRIVNNLAMELADRGDLRESIPQYERAIALDPNNPVAYYNLGNTYAALGQRAKAAASYEHALVLDQSFLYAYRPLVNLYLEAESYVRVRELLELYLRTRGTLEPDLQNVLNLLKGNAV